MYTYLLAEEISKTNRKSLVILLPVLETKSSLVPSYNFIIVSAWYETSLNILNWKLINVYPM